MILPFDLGPVAAGFMVAVILVAAFVRGYSGFGYPIMVITAGSLITNPLLLIPVAILGDMVLCAQFWRSARAHVHWPIVGRLALGAMFGLLAGVWSLTLMTEEIARIMVSIMVLLTSLFILSGWTIPGRAGPAATLGSGVVSGLFAPAGVAGPPAVILVTALGLTPQVFRATLLAYFIGLNVMTLAQFSLAGRVSLETFGVTAVSVPLVVLGGWLGAHRVSTADPAQFRRVIIVILMVMAALGLAKELL